MKKRNKKEEAFSVDPIMRENELRKIRNKRIGIFLCFLVIAIAILGIVLLSVGLTNWRVSLIIAGGVILGIDFIPFVIVYICSQA